ncbi:MULTISPECIES: hypothetical protein [unclassified Streptomyces]|uniref:hypothetical protein n=1 Tax=unclassified Streptomyces TaxID=2593676 RepID=UPI00081E2E64|nr:MULTISPECIES: hypothetical protein [unclassified Streptomyces]MYZ35973.1 hypothetical protein [Streptomyces sp. SID4917]SCF79888.1 hypothetical protein GA0115259_1027726 [Streptomyces sp. MnatMP-M17]
MADSERSQGRDDDAPDPQEQEENLDAGRGDGIAGQRDQQEPDRGVAPWQSWVRLAVEVIFPLVNQILDLINGSGG